MPKLLEKLPKYRKHSARNVAFVVLGIRRVYPNGRHGSAESKAEYKAKVLEWNTSCRTSTAATVQQSDLTLKVAKSVTVDRGFGFIVVPSRDSTSSKPRDAREIRPAN